MITKNEYYKTYGNYHKEIKKLLEYTIREKYLKVQNQALIDSWNLHKRTIGDEKLNHQLQYHNRKKFEQRNYPDNQLIFDF